MNLDKKNIIKITVTILSILLILVTITNLATILKYVSAVLSVLSPIIIGLCFAFVLNIPLKIFENKCFAGLNKKGSKRWERARRPICIILSILLFFAIIALLIVIIIPQFMEALGNFAVSLPEYMDTLDSKLSNVIMKLTGKNDENRFRINWKNISSLLLSFVNNNSKNTIGATIDIIKGAVKSILNIIVGFVISIYILASKEKLSSQIKKLLYSIFKSKTVERLLTLAALSNQSLSNFIIGQCTEAIIIGALCAVGMIIFGMPYVPIVSCVIAVTALIPVFGAFIGTGIGAFMILLVSPIKALWFIIYILILQQFETNVIYPKVVGKSVGLPGLWVLIAVTIGGEVGGAFGMIIGVPTLSVVYTLLREWSNKRLAEKGIDVDTLILSNDTNTNSKKAQ